MNANTYCREQLDNGRRCGLKYNHREPHSCCSLHRPLEERRADERRYG